MLLQVVPVTRYGPRGYFTTHAMLHTGSTCSLLLADVAEMLGLDGPLESVLLNGIQKTSELLTKRINVQASPLKDFSTQFDVNGVLVVDHLNVPENIKVATQLGNGSFVDSDKFDATDLRFSSVR